MLTKNFMIVNFLLVLSIQLQLGCGDSIDGSTTTTAAPLIATKINLTADKNDTLAKIEGQAALSATDVQNPKSGKPRSRQVWQTNTEKPLEVSKINLLETAKKEHITNASSTSTEAPLKEHKEHLVAVAPNVVLNVTDIKKSNVVQVASGSSSTTTTTTTQPSIATGNITSDSAAPNHLNAAPTTQIPTPTTANDSKLKYTEQAAKNTNNTKTAFISNSTTSPKSTTTSTTTTTTTTSTTTKATTTTTTTPKPKPKKPLITYSVADFPELDAEVLKDSINPVNTPSEPPMIPELEALHEAPHAQPSQEHDSSPPYRNRDYIVPIVSIMFVAPLCMGIVITAYRRFRDFWSTRHYRRMDFLVDGIYND